VAKFKVEYGGDEFSQNLEKLGRDGIKSIVMSGADAAVKEMQDLIEAYHHVVHRDMKNAVGPGKYHEDLNSAWVEVYPQGNDRRGVSNAKKAYVINYGRGKKKGRKSGDKFITGNKNKMQSVVSAAMQAASDRLIQEINK